MTPEERAAYQAQIHAEREAAARERAAGHFDPPRRGIADLPPEPKRWATAAKVAIYVLALFGAAALGKYLAGWLP